MNSGGFLTGIHLAQDGIKDGSHWDMKTGGISLYYSFRYGHAIPALREIKALAVRAMPIMLCLIFD